MPSLAFDTNAAVKKLEKAGLTRAQADAITDVIQEIDTSTLATKADLLAVVNSLELAIAKQATHQTIWFTGALLAQGALIVALIEYLK